MGGGRNGVGRRPELAAACVLAGLGAGALNEGTAFAQDPGAGEPTSAPQMCAEDQVGTEAPDTLVGTANGDRLAGVDGRDTLDGREAEDCLVGGRGGDTITGGPGRDWLRGGGGHDRIFAVDGERERVKCGRGRDWVRADRRDRVRGCERVKVPGRGGDHAYPPAPEIGPVPPDARYLSPSGSDSNPGTREAPLRTIAKAQSLAQPGDTFVLLPGTYGAVGATQSMGKSGTSSAPITFRGDPEAQMPRIVGHTRISGSYQRFNYLLFDGPTGQVKPLTSDNPDGEQVTVMVYGDAVRGVEISDSEIRDSGWHAGIFLSTAINVKITGNYIHDNGDFDDPSQANLSHGIYFDDGSGLIANNVIEHNVARGVQLYTQPHDVTIANNTIVDNGKAGILFGTATADSRAVNNLVAYNGEYGIRSYSLSGEGNVARRNLVYGHSKDNLLGAGMTTSENIQESPGFSAGSTNYRPPAESPAVDQALAGYAPPTDYDEVARPRGAAPDLGAFEVG